MGTKPSYEELERRVEELQKKALECEQAKEDLRESERRFRAIFDQTFQFIGLMRPDGTLIEANRTALEFIGVAASDVIDKPFWETPWWSHSPELQKRLAEAVRAAARGEFVRFEASHPVPGGGLKYVDFSLKPVMDEAGRVVLLIPEGRDITDRKAAEDALRESENTARALLDAFMDSAILLDPSGVILSANKIAAERLGVPPEEFVGKPIFSFMPPDVAESRRMRLSEAVCSGTPVRFEDQSQGRFYDHNVYPVLDSTGEAVQVAVFSREITHYKLAKARIEERTAQLMESEAKYRTLVENIPLVVYRIKPGGEILFVNQVVEDVFGFSPEEILRTPELWRERVYEEDRPRVKELRERSLLEGRELVAEYRVKHKKGHIVYVTDHAIPVRAPDGQVRSVDGIIMDVTGRVKLQEQLVQAGEIKTISRISERLAHEIRNPLVSAGGFARRLLSSMSHEDPNRAKVEIIVKEVGRLEAILRMILSYIQPIDLHVSQTDAGALIEAALGTLTAELEKQNVHLDLRLAPGLPKVSVDRAQMEHALEILVRNALTQMERGATLSVSAFRENSAFKVILHYPILHISSDDLQHFFYPFACTQMACQVPDLAMSKILVDKHGGTIDVRLDNEHKLTIEISLPL